MTRRWLFHQAARLSAFPFAGGIAVAAPEPEADEPAPDWLGEIEAGMPTGTCVVIGGYAHEVITWSWDQWLAMPEEDRPPGSSQDTRDGRYVVRRVADDCALEDLSPDP